MLLDIGGKPLLWHTWTRARQAQGLGRLVIAAGDSTIFDAVKAFGGDVVDAFEDVPSGSDRVYCAWQKLILSEPALGARSDVIILNIQGDEPQINPLTIDATVQALIDDPEAGVGTAVTPILTIEEYIQPSTVKVVLDDFSRAIYFTRSPIPHGWTPESPIPAYRHMGLYAFRVSFLETFTKLPQPQIELLERLEQLRLMAHGVKFAVAVVPSAGQEVNTQEDLDRVRAALP